MNNVNWSRFAVTDSDGEHPEVPALCCFLYFGAGIHDVGEEIAEGIERYIGFVGLDVLRSFAAKSGEWKAMTKRQLDKDLRHLRDFPKDHKAANIIYDAGEWGEPGGFGVHVSVYAEDEEFPTRAGQLRVDFPPQWLNEHDAEPLVNFVATLSQLPHVQSGHAGLTFKTTPGSQGDAASEIFKRLPRYFGFSPCDFSLRNEMLGHTFVAHWLNYVDQGLAASLGGPNAIVSSLPECDVRKLKKGLLIRGAKLPPIGDINRKAPDLGRLPEVSRLLKPTRLDIETTYLANDDPTFDAGAWIERMDELDARAWDNSRAF